MVVNSSLRTVETQMSVPEKVRADGVEVRGEAQLAPVPTFVNNHLPRFKVATKISRKSAAAAAAGRRFFLLFTLLGRESRVADGIIGAMTSGAIGIGIIGGILHRGVGDGFLGGVLVTIEQQARDFERVRIIRGGVGVEIVPK